MANFVKVGNHVRNRERITSVYLDTDGTVLINFGEQSGDGLAQMRFRGREAESLRKVFDLETRYEGPT